VKRILRAAVAFARREPRFRVTGSAASDVGRLRHHNEDRFVFAHLGSDDDAPPSPLRSMPATGALLLVADGMGGRAAGDVASTMASRIVAGHLRAAWCAREARTSAQVAEALRAALTLANDEIHEFASGDPDRNGMGTTATAAVLVGASLAVAHVGDTRAYVVRGGREQRLTRDHSWAQHLLDTGAASAEEVERHAPANILLRALGPQPEVVIDLSEHRVRAGDVLVLCSDGLWSAVAEHEIAAIVSTEANLAVAGQALIDLANVRGGRDNVTVLVARVETTELACEPDDRAG
jgi:protein phosphatase